jgi:hypothetical protein
VHPKAPAMATIAAVEKQIREREGFRVRLTPLGEKTKSIPDYAFSVMAPQRWKISDWKTRRLAGYVTLLRDVTVYRGDGEVVRRDMQLGNLRDSYYEAECGKAPEGPADVVPLRRRKRGAAKRR